MHRFLSVVLAIISFLPGFCQSPKTYTSSEILLQIKKLNVVGAVLYIAAHPDDENTRLLAYLANEKLYRTGYLSLTRGDGGQNLIGDEQGIDLGLIRTQELLAARRIDGAEQFFSTAYDFGFSKSSKEALETWGHDKILSDAVWVIRNFKPDVIITRFPEDARAGHGHHAASAIIAREAFEAAADPKMFPEQLAMGVSVHQAKRLLWNTFNFGNTNTQSEDQFKLDVGVYNPLLGEGYGEIAAHSRSEHKSQGFGVPAQRGKAIEYFSTIKGDKPQADLMDGIKTTWERFNKMSFSDSINKILQSYDLQHPERSVDQLVQLNKLMRLAGSDYWIDKKQQEIARIIENVTGLFLEATTSQLNVLGDTMKVNVSFVNRTGVAISSASANLLSGKVIFDKNIINDVQSKQLSVYISDTDTATQPYWLEKGLQHGRFDVQDQSLIGLPQVNKLVADFEIVIGSETFHFKKPIQYKYTDPVKGELYQPVQLVHPVLVNSKQNLVIFKNSERNKKQVIDFVLQSNRAINDSARFYVKRNGHTSIVFDSVVHLTKMETKTIPFVINSDSLKKGAQEYLSGRFASTALPNDQLFAVARIKYDHIPDIYYNYVDQVKVLKMDLETTGHSIGYIPGAGDKVPQALEQMGYKVTMLNETTINQQNLRQFDAIVTGIRVYNINPWMNNVYDVLMEYVKEGGVLVTQYNTSNQIGPVKAKISPYPFNISRGRVTDETARVKFLLPAHPVLNYPNKITEKDFEGWIQERSIYNAENAGENFQRVLGMNDTGEDMQDGSLIVADYGKGKFVYTGLVFFRQLPAGVPGAYRLFANLIANPVKKFK